MPRKKNDILLKSAFEEAFADLLRFFHKDADALFDMERGFQFMDKELKELFPEPDRKGGTRIADMLVKVFTKDGREEWILIHLEIQEQNDPQFARRMFQYFYRIYDKYNVQITARAIFTGSRKPTGDNIFTYSFQGTEATYRYNLYHIHDHTEEELLAMNNPFALIVLAAQKALLMGKVPEQELAEQRLTIARALIQSKRYDSEKIERFLLFLKKFVYIRNPEINSKFDKETDSLTGNVEAMSILEAVIMLEKEKAEKKAERKGMRKGMQEGREQGKEEGREEERRQFVISLLLNTDFDAAKIALLTGVTEDLVLQLKQGTGK